MDSLVQYKLDNEDLHRVDSFEKEDDKLILNFYGEHTISGIFRGNIEMMFSVKNVRIVMDMTDETKAFIYG